VEKLPEVGEDGSTRVPGLYVAGDLTGIPLLKFALDSGVRVVRRIAADPALRAGGGDGPLDLVIIGGGVSGMAAAVEARRLGLSFRVIEAVEPFATIANFPRGKPIFTYPPDLRPEGELQARAGVKEALLAELRAQVGAAGIEVTPARAGQVERSGGLLVVRLEGGGSLAARRVLVAIGRSGDFRRLNVPGEDRDKVANRLHDPADFRGMRVLVVGGGDSALEAAIALAESGARVTLSHRGRELTRPRPENVAALGRVARGPDGVDVRPGTHVREIRGDEVLLAEDGGAPVAIPNDFVFNMTGREAPLGFLRRSGVPIRGEMTPGKRAGMALFLLFCAWLYNWKSGGSMAALFERNRWFPFNLPDLLGAAGGAVAAAAADPRTLAGTLAISAAGPSFWYTLTYSIVVTVFGVRRIRRRRTPYVTAQTLALMAVQVLPLFLLPEVILPLLGHHGLLPRSLADALFPGAAYGHGREYWRAYGLVLAWPLNVYNVFTQQPLGWWLGISAVQTLVLLPLGIRFFGKGFYCGWICSCGALAETLGDTHRRKMPHGPGWNRLNMGGQWLLAAAVALLLVRIAGWLLPAGNAADRIFDPLLKTPWAWIVDVGLAGVLGYGVYFWFSGRVWCRFLCPLAALMHLYARASRFAILPEKRKCISCNVCTSVCHMGIDVMSFANRGLPMQDPQCVRCSACVRDCPTGVLAFGQVDRSGRAVRLDLLPASPVRMRESR
jgi:thioredoxin reductase/NAD-dependent dihydropyrimidine dehydrogenase PreA subunit